MLKDGQLIVFDGGEGCGKSTQAKLLAQAISNTGLEVLHTCQPGGTSVGCLLRNQLLNSKTPMSPSQQALLFSADRAIHVAEVLKPALADKKVVICDRWASSTYAYQGIGPISDDLLEKLKKMSTDGLVPDLLLILDIDPAVGFRRKSADTLDNFEALSIEFHQMVRDRFLDYAAFHHGAPFDVIDADDTIVKVHRRIIRAINNFGGPKLSALDF